MEGKKLPNFMRKNSVLNAIKSITLFKDQVDVKKNNKSSRVRKADWNIARKEKHMKHVSLQYVCSST